MTTIPTLFSICTSMVNPRDIDEKIKSCILDHTDFWTKKQKMSDWRIQLNAKIPGASACFFANSRFEAIGWDTFREPGEISRFHGHDWDESYDSIYRKIFDYYGVPSDFLVKSREEMEEVVGITGLPAGTLRHEFVVEVLTRRFDIDGSDDVMYDRYSRCLEIEEQLQEETNQRDLEECMKVIREYDYVFPDDILSDHWTANGYDTVEKVARFIADKFRYNYDEIAEYAGRYDPIDILFSRMYHEVIEGRTGDERFAVVESDDEYEIDLEGDW